jgi:hypothetical protein
MRKRWWIPAWALCSLIAFYFLIWRKPVVTEFQDFPVASGDVLYYFEELPIDIASALPSFASDVVGSAAALSENELAIAADDKDRHYLGLVPRGTRAADVPRSAFLALIKDGRAVRAPLANDMPLKLVRVISGDAARAIVVAIAAYRQSLPQSVLGSTSWNKFREKNTVTVWLSTPRVKGDNTHFGWNGDPGSNVFYDVDTETFAIVRTGHGR